MLYTIIYVYVYFAIDKHSPFGTSSPIFLQLFQYVCLELAVFFRFGNPKRVASVEPLNCFGLARVYYSRTSLIRTRLIQIPG